MSKKSQQIKELREKTTGELNQLISEMQQGLQEQRVNFFLQNVVNHQGLKVIRRKLAQAHTVIKESISSQTEGRGK